MDNVVSKKEFEMQKEAFFDNIEGGAIFIHPTDTIYGIGGNAQSSSVAKKIREIKKRPKKPFSIIAPSKQWIKKNCVLNEKDKKWVEKLPGPYTLILKMKNENCVSKEVAQKTLGVRIPEHWISNIVEELKFPIISTSANISGEEHMTSLKNLEKNIKKEMEFIIYEGEKEARPSKIIDLVNNTKKER